MTLITRNEKQTAANVTYGFNEDNDLVASNYHILYKDDKEQGVRKGLLSK